jgi:hypothetical protein
MAVRSSWRDDGTAGDFDQKDGDDNPMWTRLERNR